MGLGLARPASSLGPEPADLRPRIPGSASVFFTCPASRSCCQCATRVFRGRQRLTIRVCFQFLRADDLAVDGEAEIPVLPPRLPSSRRLQLFGPWFLPWLRLRFLPQRRVY